MSAAALARRGPGLPGGRSAALAGQQAPGPGPGGGGGEAAPRLPDPGEQP